MTCTGLQSAVNVDLKVSILTRSSSSIVKFSFSIVISDRIIKSSARYTSHSKSDVTTIKRIIARAF